MKHFTDAVHKAAHDAAKHMSTDLQKSALKHGWHSDVVRNMEVKFQDGKFNVDIHPDYKDRAFMHEFGDETTRPTAVLRKYDSQTKDAEKTFTKQMYKHLGKKL